MNFIKFRNEVLKECFIEANKAHITFICVVCLDNLWFQQEVLNVANFELEILAHQIGQKSTNFYFHWTRNCGDVGVVN